MRAGKFVGAAVAVGLLGGALANGCMVVTGSTDGYVAAEAGDAGSFCVSAESCTAHGTPGACCLGASGISCEATGCGAANIQLCASNAECGDAGACALQLCALSAGEITLLACGTLPNCGVIASFPSGGSTGGTDAGEPETGTPRDGGSDASAIDAGAGEASTPDAGAADATIADGGADAAG